MPLEYIVALTLISGLTGMFFWMFRRSFLRMDELDQRLRDAITENEVRSLVDDKLEPLRSQHADLARRLTRLEAKIDRLIELTVNK